VTFQFDKEVNTGLEKNLGFIEKACRQVKYSFFFKTGFFMDTVHVRGAKSVKMQL
jgi:hypothetical protein